MADNFDLRKYLAENKLTSNSKLEEQVVYEKSYGGETYGEVRLINGEYVCFVTSLYGGDWIEEGRYSTLEEAIEFIESIT